MPWQSVADLALVAAAAITSALLIMALMPLLRRYALARPNARSSHKTPTPQGAGVAVVAATALCFFVAAALDFVALDDVRRIATLFAGVLLLAALGGLDDVRPLGALTKLAPQIAAVLCVVLMLPDDARAVSLLPLWLERALEVVAGVYFVNVVNFMDGIDWMTVSHALPLNAGVALVGIDAPLASALLGAVAGFAPFNRPTAKVFLGDVGSLPLGLFEFAFLLELGVRGHLAAAFILPLYYLADGTFTLLRRLARRENIFQAHRSHAYQRAVASGMSVRSVIGRVFAVNVTLAGLALWGGFWALPIAAVLVLVVVWELLRSHGRSEPTTV